MKRRLRALDMGVDGSYSDAAWLAISSMIGNTASATRVRAHSAYDRGRGGRVMLRVYRGREGMISWALHRLTGLGVLMFLFIHIADIFVIGYGPEEFDSLLFIYHALPFRILEIALVGALYYHAINGVRIILIDFWDRGVLIQRQLFRGVIVVFVLTFIPTALLMLRPLL